MEHAFDARQVMLSDEDRPHSQRRTVSLVTALRGAITQDGGPSEDSSRIAWMRAIVDELTDRGLDGQSLIRLGMSPEITGTILLDVALRRFGNDVFSSDEHVIDIQRQPRLDESTGEAWDTLIPAPERTDTNSDSGVTIEMFTTVFLEGATTIYPWIASAPLETVLRLTPPTPAQLAAMTAETPIPERDVLEDYRWIVDRFAITDLQDWAESSLHHEHRWLSGQQPTPCNAELMRDRRIPAVQLNAEIARRAVNETPQERMLREMAPTLAAKMQQRATVLLLEGRSREAAALFEFAVSQDPNDAAALNNLGFCLVVTDPRQALTYLRKAYDLGYQPTAINIHNRALCHILIHEHRTALSLITESWGSPDSPDQGHAVLWSWQDPEVTLNTGASCTRELALLARQVANVVGDTAAVDHWTEVIASLG